MKIERVEVQGFRSFRDLETFDFDTTPGLINLTGINEDEPALGANGAGKSSLWEAILWCLYGSSSAGLKGPEIASWGQGRGVYVLCRVNGQRVVRTWGSGNNTLCIDGDDVKQEDVDNAVGLTREQFLFCSYMAQHADAFLDLGATAKTDLLASILDLDKWLDYSAEAAKRSKALEADLRSVEKSLAAVDASMRTLEETDYALLHAEWVREKRESLAGNIEAAEAVQKRIDVFEDDIGPQLSRSVSKLLRSWDVACDDAAKQRDTVSRQRERIKSLEDRVAADAKARKQGVCDACGQRLPHSHITREQAQAFELKLLAEQEALVGMLGVLKKSLARVDVETKELEAERKAMRDAEHINNLNLKHLEQLSERRRELRAMRSPYEGLIVDKAQSLERMKRERAVVESHQVRIESEHAATVQWVQSFKDVRLFLVAEALLQLEVEVNSALAQLGLADWEIRFAPDSETKAGAVKRGFSVTVLSPSNERAVPWQVWSGGEAQRLRVAASMGLSNLIAAYTGYKAFVEVWDEPTNGMSSQGIADLLAAMKERAERDGKQVWIIDHRALDSGLFQQTITAVKCDGTTTLRRNENGQGE